MDPKDLLLKHFEKGVLALAGIWLIVIGVGFVGEPAELSENERLVQALRGITIPQIVWRRCRHE